MLIKRPLKALSESLEDRDLPKLSYPVYGSVKIDGLRCLVDEIPKTSSMKPHPNPFVQEILSSPEFHGLDGELVVGKLDSPDVFNLSTGPLRRKYGSPDFTFYVFDSFLNPNETYFQRWLSKTWKFTSERVKYLPQIPLSSPEEVIHFTEMSLHEGFEGAIVRNPYGLYKQGRSTFREQIIFKRKPYTDAEATIIGFNAKMINLNPQEINELGLAKRASNQENKIPVETLGSFILYDPQWENTFTCRGKINDSLALEIWNNKEKYIGKKVTYKYQALGSLKSPRQPIFKRFFKEI